VLNHDQLLVVTTATPDTLVEDDLAPRLIDQLGHRRVALLGKVRLPRVGSPQQPSDLRTSPGNVGEDSTDLGTGPVEELVAVALPVYEVHAIAGFD
jgi:hypothetical protein